jgi:hypothetical protein
MINRLAVLSGSLLTVTLLLARVAVAADVGGNDNPSPKEMLDELKALRAEVKDLRSKVQAQQPATQPVTQPASPDPLAVRAQAAASLQESKQEMMADLTRRPLLSDETPFLAGWDPAKGFVIRSDDGNFLLHPWAFIQVRDAVNYRQQGRTGGGDDTQQGLELPRMKLILDGNVFTPDFTYQFIWATYSPNALAAPVGGYLFLQDAWLRYRFPGTPFAVRAGNIRDPFDHEAILFGTRSLTPDRSIINNVMINGDNIVKGISGSYGYDSDSPFRTEIAYTGGMRNTDTVFQPFPTTVASWGAAGRFEYKFFGDWKDYTQFTALGDKTPLLVLGGGADYTEAGDTASLMHVIDLQFDTPDGLNFWGAYMGRYVRRNDGAPGTNGGSTAQGRFPDTYDQTLRFQGGYLFAQRFEPFARYEYILFDGNELPHGFAKDDIQDITLGFNYYFQGHRLKLTAAASYLPDGSPIANPQSDLLTNRKNEVIFQAQLQLMI